MNASGKLKIRIKKLLS